MQAALTCPAWLQHLLQLVKLLGSQQQPPAAAVGRLHPDPAGIGIGGHAC